MMIKLKKINVLILEDSPTQAAELEYILDQGGYSSTIVVNGKEALEYLNDSNNIMPDIIISDIVMPEMNGFDFCKLVKKTDYLKNIPVILLTSLSDPTDVISGLECGADNFITKPYKSDYLLARINYLLINFDMRRNQASDETINIQFAGKKYKIISGRTQILDLLVSSFESAVQKNSDLNLAIQELKDTQQKLVLAKDELNQLATHDALTNIYNRRAFKEIATKMIALANRKNRKIAVLHLDVDNFKLINDSLGHKVGDEVLKAMTSKLVGILREEDIIGRIGGDEFAVVLMDIGSVDEAITIANKIIGSFKNPINIESENIFVTFSLGISLSKTMSVSSSYSEMLKEADLAMYEAKRSGKSQYRLFNRQIKVKYERRQSLEEELNRALRKNEFSMVYQPIIDLSNKKIVGVESLIRWKNEKLGIISPDEFIKFAENNRQIHEIGYWVIDEVLRQCSMWNKNSELKDCFVTFNISSVQFERRNFIPKLINCLNKYKVNSRKIVIEITETAFSQFLKTETLLKMKREDILIAIDDFGSGYSSMHRLLELPIDFIKIDGEYTRKVLDDKKYMNIIKNILNMAKSLNIKAIAECVETKKQAEFLRENGCNYAQGFYYYKPLKPNEVAKLLQ
jgi:diguanylate cyclase (GGDEF)-like protein